MRNEDFLSYKVSVLSRILDRDVDKRLVACLHLPLTSLRILGHLHAHGEGRVLAIARGMHLLGSQVSQSMMDLVAYGHVAKKPDPQRQARHALPPHAPRAAGSTKACSSTRKTNRRPSRRSSVPPTTRIVSECLDTLIAHYGAPAA